MNRLVWQPHMIEDGRIIDGTVFAEPIEDRAVIARIGGNDIRRRAWAGALIDPTNGSGLILRFAIERFAPSYGRHQRLYGEPITCADHPGGCGNVASEAELRAMAGDR